MASTSFRVPPLPIPNAHVTLSPARLLDFPSIALFVQRATAVNPDFRLSVQNASAIAEICRRLDGLPLAIELAAARAKVLPPASLLARIASRLELLTGGARDLPERQRTLRRTIDWSYDLLTPPEQKLFRRLSIFVSGNTLEGAEAVCDTQEDLGVDLLETITSLVDKSLIRQSSLGDDEPRFMMLETIREYARERLDMSGELDLTRKAHAAYCLVLAEEGIAAMTEPEQEDWLARCDAEHGNFRAAIEHLVMTGNAEWGLRLGASLWWFWESREHLTEGRAALAALLEMPAADSLSVYRARALLAAGVLADAQLDHDAADELTNRSLEMHRQLDDKHGMAAAFNTLAFQASRRGNYALARSNLDQALLLWDQLGTGRVMLGLTNLDAIAKRQGDYTTARTTYEKVLEVFRSSGDVRGIASALNGLGEVAMAQGDYAGARSYFLESLALFEKIEDRWAIAGVQRDLGNLSREEGDYAGACVAYCQALAMFRALGHRRGIARVLEHLAFCATSQAIPERALKLAGAAAALREKLGTPLSAAERAEFDQHLRRAHESLVPSEQANPWTEGRATPLDQIVDYALALEQAE